MPSMNATPGQATTVSFDLRPGASSVRQPTVRQMIPWSSCSVRNFADNRDVMIKPGAAATPNTSRLKYAIPLACSIAAGELTRRFP